MKVTEASRALFAPGAFLAFALLGLTIHVPVLAALDRAGASLLGHGIAVALFFTALGRWYAVVAVLAVLVAVYRARGADVRVPLALGLSQALSQLAVAGLKLGFGRSRPAHWLVIHEPGFSYPSGHAVTAIVFYGGLVLLVSRARDLPMWAKLWLVLPAAVCIAGIPWSRLVLGAHYTTDVLGGLFFGAGWLCVTAILGFARSRKRFSASAIQHPRA
jgi:undecaprenyl-diphosphatase